VVGVVVGGCVGVGVCGFNVCVGLVEVWLVFGVVGGFMGVGGC